MLATHSLFHSPLPAPGRGFASPGLGRVLFFTPVSPLSGLHRIGFLRVKERPRLVDLAGVGDWVPVAL